MTALAMWIYRLMLLSCCLLLPAAWANAVTPANNTPVSANAKAQKPATTPAQAVAGVQAHLQAELQKQAIRLGQLESANREALTQNQTLQLENDNLAVQVKVLQGERSAQMFLYGAATIAVGAVLGFLWASAMQRRNRRW
jgi:predicted hotdog family 3-hydroxylacyl-ACP dehydratase